MLTIKKSEIDLLKTLLMVNGMQKFMPLFTTPITDTSIKRCIGAVIDNRSSAPVKLIEEEDRSDITKAQQLFDNFFNTKTKIQH
eukprot:15357946-Ditylum_brightwellii.AAC.1